MQFVKTITNLLSSQTSDEQQSTQQQQAATTTDQPNNNATTATQSPTNNPQMSTEELDSTKQTTPVVELTAEYIADQLRGIERYNPEHKDLLIDYLEFQCKNNQYDLEANLTLLKLFQFSPHQFQATVVEKILLKALTNLPHQDFILCELLIDSSKPDLGNIQAITAMHTKLTLCQFKEFWIELANQKELHVGIVGFEDSIRKYICHVVGITYQHIRTPILKDFLGVQSQQEFDEWMKKSNWKMGDEGYVKIENQEYKIKTINITEKIELEQVANILATYR